MLKKLVQVSYLKKLAHLMCFLKVTTLFNTTEQWYDRK